MRSDGGWVSVEIVFLEAMIWFVVGKAVSPLILKLGNQNVTMLHLVDPVRWLSRCRDMPKNAFLDLHL